MKEVFISYKSEELEEACWVKSILENNGISCWMAPASIPGGSSYAVEIPQAIRQCRIFVLILSSKAQASQWVSREVDLAINEGKIVLPFMLENCTLKDDFNFYLTNVQRYAAYENKAAAIEKMLREIKAVLGINNSANIAEEKQEPVMEKKENITQPALDKTRKSKLCVYSLIYGIVSMVLVFGAFVPLDIAAMVLSVMGIKDIREKQLSGKKMAIAGQILGIVGLIIGFTASLSFLGLIIAVILSDISLIMFRKELKKLKNTLS